MATIDSVMEVSRIINDYGEKEEVIVKGKKACSCGGDIVVVEKKYKEYIPSTDLIGPSQTSDIHLITETSDLHCQKCGIKYEFVPPFDE